MKIMKIKIIDIRPKLMLRERQKHTLWRFWVPKSDESLETHAACSPWLHKSPEPAQSRLAISALRHEPNQAAATKSRSTYYTLCLRATIAHCIIASKPVQQETATAIVYLNGAPRETLIAAASARRGTILQLEPLSTAIKSRARVSSAQ
jgi:hypothetical protein